MNEEIVPTGETTACLWNLGDFPSLGTNSGLPKCLSFVQCTSFGTELGLIKRCAFGRAHLWTLCTYCALVCPCGLYVLTVPCVPRWEASGEVWIFHGI